MPPSAETAKWFSAPSVAPANWSGHGRIVRFVGPLWITPTFTGRYAFSRKTQIGFLNSGLGFWPVSRIR